MTVPTRTVGVLDTNVVILFPRIAEASALPDDALITTITLAELSLGPLAAGTEEERAKRQARLEFAVADFDALPFDEAAARAFGQVGADIRSAGRKPSARTYDALIAAIAVANGLPLYTVNAGDFSGISALEVVPVPHPDQD